MFPADRLGKALRRGSILHFEVCRVGKVRATELNHTPGGANVLYMDGHVEVVRYPEQYDPGPLSIIGAVTAF